jgi:hypothetical protein
VLKLLIRLLEAIGLRAAPGLVNLATLLLVGGWRSADDYGQYSTIVATTGCFANMAFGPLTSAVVSQQAKLEAEGLAGSYESSLVSGVLMVADDPCDARRACGDCRPHRLGLDRQPP